MHSILPTAHRLTAGTQVAALPHWVLKGIVRLEAVNRYLASLLVLDASGRPPHNYLFDWVHAGWSAWDKELWRWKVAAAADGRYSAATAARLLGSGPQRPAQAPEYRVLSSSGEPATVHRYTTIDAMPGWVQLERTRVKDSQARLHMHVLDQAGQPDASKIAGIIEQTFTQWEKDLLAWCPR